MQTIERSSSTPALPYLRATVDRLRAAILARRPGVRVGLLLALVFVLAASGYWAAVSLVPVGTRYLASGRSFASDDLIKICRALDGKGIAYHVDDRKVEIAADQFDQAAVIFAKLDVGPQPLDELVDPAGSWSFLDTPHEREQKDRLRRERMIARFIDGLDGVVWSLVAIRYPRAELARHSRAKPSAFVYLETEPDRPLPSRTVQTIPAIVMSNEPELSHDAITVMDRRGRRYLDPHNPALGDQSRDRAREEEIRAEILEKLGWIKGVQVWVELIDRRDPEPGSGSTIVAPPARDRADTATTIGVNRPLALDEPPPPLSPPPAPRDPRPARGERGRILVNVPRSFYLERILPRADHRDPTPEELLIMSTRVKEQVSRTVSLVVPASWKLDVDTIPDDVPLSRTAVLPAGPDSRRKMMDWGIVASIVAVVAVLTALASWFQVVRRPARLSAPEAEAAHYRADFAEEPHPSDQVRELVRRDPEAAASVLQRWIAQGGRVS
jgi:flagellar biosynthesis/type III secretory pathway M-ring protein FliF/YscJ